MQIDAVMVGSARPIATKTGTSGIDKRPVDGPVQVGPLGLEGDTIIDLDNHGGRDQAVYIYTAPDYAFWAEELGHDMRPGTFGENILISDLETSQMCVGDRLTLGPVEVEVTSPRIPCSTFAAHMGDKTFPKKFYAATRPGIYVRVLTEGAVQAGDPVTYSLFDGPKITMDELFHGYPFATASDDLIARVRQAPVHYKMRDDFDERFPVR